MDLNELKAKVTALNDERKKIVQAEGQKAISEAFRQLFEAHPRLESVTWAQYTPYFNDGDACTFSLHGIREAVFDGKEDEDPCWGDDEHGIKEPLRELEKALEGLGDSMELIFGDHVQVKATRGGFEIEEYEHD